MATRRSRGDGGIRWSETRKRWIVEVTVGYKPNGKRDVRSASSKSKTEAKDKLRGLLRDIDDGVAVAPHDYTVAMAVENWLKRGLRGRDAETVNKLTSLANTHVIPALGNKKLRALSADDVDEWLEGKAETLATRTLGDLRSILRRSVSHAQAREKVKRNVVLLCELPKGKPGRPSKSLTFEQAEALLTVAEQSDSTIGAYIVVSLLSGVRTEEMRPLRWSRVDLLGRPDAVPPVPPHVMVWRSVRAGGDTKTKKSKRSLGLPQRCVAVLKAHKARQDALRALRGGKWHDPDVVFASEVGTELDAHNVRRAFRRLVKKAGLKAGEWTPRELRHSFVSLLSAEGVPIEQISRLVGHSSSTVTEQVYRHQLVPVVQDESGTLDRLFPGPTA